MLMCGEAEAKELVKQAEKINKLLKGKSKQDTALCLNRNW